MKLLLLPEFAREKTNSPVETQGSNTAYDISFLLHTG